MATKIAENSPSAHVERQHIEQMLVYLVADVLACFTDQTRPFLYLDREQSFMVMMWEAERARSCFFFLNILNSVENIGALQEKLCNLGIRLGCLMVIAGHEMGQKPVLDNRHNSGNEEGDTVLFLGYSVGVHYEVRYLNRREITTHYSVHLIGMATQLEQFFRGIK